MDLTKNQIVAAVKVGDEIIPFWDSRVEYVNSEYYGKGFKIKGREYYNIIEAIYNLKTKTLSLGIPIEYHYKGDESKIGKEYYYKRDDDSIELVTLLGYGEYKIVSPQKGKNLPTYIVANILNYNPSFLYLLTEYKPTYILSNGVETQWSYKLLTKYQPKNETNINQSRLE